MRPPGAGPLHPVETFTTTDGVDLGLVRWGPDPAESRLPLLLLVHGGVTAYQCFEPLIPWLSGDRPVVAYDRRGRGISGDAAEYSIQREVDDLIEVARHVGNGNPVDVLGYSYGGMVTLHALTSDAFRRVVVYEPPFAVPGMPPDGMAGEVVALLDKGEVDDALRLFISQTFKLPESVVSAMARHPMWQVSRDAAPTIPREFEALAQTSIPTDARPDLPVLVLVAKEAGNPAFRDIAARLEAALPDVAVEHVGGIPHFAIATDTEHFAERVASFLDA